VLPAAEDALDFGGEAVGKDEAAGGLPGLERPAARRQWEKGFQRAPCTGKRLFSRKAA